MEKKAYRPKGKLWFCASVLLLIVVFLLHSGYVHAQEPAIDPLKNEGGQEVPPLTLADVIDLVLRDNRSLISSTYGVEGQELSLESARSEFELKLFPQASVDATDEARRVGGGVRVEKRFALGPIASVSPEVFREYDSGNEDEYGSQLAVSLTVPLLRGFGPRINLSGVRAAEYSLRSAKRSHYLVKVNTVLEAVAAVYSVIQQRELADLYQTQVSRFEEHVVMAEAREKIGLASPIDVYRARIRLKDAQNSLNRAQEALRNAGDRLKIVLATPLEQAVHVVAPLDIQPVDIGMAQAVETAMQYRVELKQVDDDIEEAKRVSRLSKNNLLPQLNLVSSYTRLGEDGITQLNEDFWSVSLVSTTDWARTAEKAAYRQSLLTIKQARLNRSTRVDTIKREVRQFYDSLQKAQERMQIRDDQIFQARGKLALAKIKFGHGMADNFDLIEAETELQEARTNLLAARIEYIVGMYRLRGALGTLIDQEVKP